MTDFTPPSDSEPPDSHDPYGAPAPGGDWGQSPPAGIPPQPSPWGQPGQGWNDPNAHAHGQPGYGAPDQQYDPNQYDPNQQQWAPGWQGHGAYAGHRYPKSSQATTALVLAILGLICCGPLAVIGAVMGRSEVNAIGRGEIDPAQHGTAQAGFIIGLIGSILWGIGIAFYVFAIAISVAAGP